LWITSAKIRLLADSNTPALDINVDTRDGVVTLFGIVPTKQAKAAAEADTKKVSGVKSVRNELEVVPAKDEKIVKVQDNQIEGKVESSLGNHDQFKSVKVEVKNGVARLWVACRTTATARRRR
jgi:osmotically-inducible protein OsmY